MMTARRISIVLPCLAAILLIGCGGNGGSNSGGATNGDVIIVNSIQVDPDTISVAPGDQQQFTAEVDGNDSRVSWSVDGDGSITQDGLYTAPDTEGHATVIATAVSDPDVQGTADVTIIGPR